MTPQKYPQNLHTPKNTIIFLKTRKKLKFKILNTKNDHSLRMYENIRVPPPPPPPAPPGVDQSLVSKSIKKLNPKKATGVDQLAAELIKAGSTALAGPISTVFNLCANKNQFPNDLKCSGPSNS